MCIFKILQFLLEQVWKQTFINEIMLKLVMLEIRRKVQQKDKLKKEAVDVKTLYWNQALQR